MIKTAIPEISVHDKQNSEYFAVPAGLLALEPHLPCLEGLTEADLRAENYLEVPDSTALLHQYERSMQKIGAHVPLLFVGNMLRGSYQYGAYSDLIASNPNAMFSRDVIGAAAPWLGQIIMAKMNLEGRKDEPGVTAHALRLLGAEVVELGLESQDTLEGGDVIPACFDGKRTLLVGISDRTTERAAKALFDELEEVDQIIMVNHPGEILHLDTGMTLYAGPESGPGAAVVAEGMFQEAVLLDRHNPGGSEEIDMYRFLENNGFQIVTVSAEDAIEQEVCNVLALGGGMYIGFDAMSHDLTARISDLTGATILTTPGDEIAKATGGLHCLTHQLYGSAILNYAAL